MVWCPQFKTVKPNPDIPTAEVSFNFPRINSVRSRDLIQCRGKSGAKVITIGSAEAIWRMEVLGNGNLWTAVVDHRD